MLKFSFQHIVSPLYYCNATELMWCGHFQCGLSWATSNHWHHVLYGTLKEMRTCYTGYYLLA